ncbi:hypothetical protein KJA15_04275 [Patescibacteria group bacterium]|nr:hypothetical protein [Patescibacteria group bacterium]
MKSFTLIEFLLVIGIIGTLISFTLSLGFSFYKNQQLETHGQEILQILRRTQAKAMSVELDSSFGVYLTDDNYTLFKGNSYTGRDAQYDEIFNLTQIIKISGLSEIVFLKIEGLPKESPAYCGGICTPCNEFTSQRPCRKQDGCSWNRLLGRCTGPCTPCNNYQNQAECEDQSGCSWYPASRGGNIILSSNGDSRTININEIGRVNLE